MSPKRSRCRSSIEQAFALASGAFAATALCCAQALAQAPEQADEEAPEQPEELVPTQQQAALYQQAYAASRQDEHERAEQLLRAAIALGELNILHLALGRALFRQGRCAEAVAEYDRAGSAPAVTNRSEDEIRERIDAYRTELDGCPGEVRIVCSPETSIRIDGGDATPCPTEPVRLPPGPHRLTAARGDRTASREVEVDAMQTVTVELSLPAPSPATPDPPAPDSAGGPDLALLGWIGTVAGGAALGAALVLDAAVLPSAVSDFERAVRDADPAAADLKNDVDALQTTTLVTYIGGGVLVAAGATLLVISLTGENEAAAPSVSVGATGASVRFGF